MVMDSRKAVGEEGFEWGADLIEAEIRSRIRSLIEGIVAEELEAALGAGKSQRVAIPQVTVEGVAHYQRLGADQRRVPPPH